MKLIFVSQDPKIKELVETLSYDNVNMLSGPSLLDEGKFDEDLTLVFLDYDNEKDELEKLNKSLAERTDVIRLIISETLSVEELKKHQASAESAHGYIRKPLSDEIVMGVMEDFEFSGGLEFIDDEEEAEASNSDATGEILVAVDGESSEDMNLEMSDDIADKESEEDLSTSEGLSFNMPEQSEEDISLDLSSEDDGGLDLSSSEDGELELSTGDDSELELSTEDEGAIELSDDSVGELELSDGSEDDSLELSDGGDIGEIELGDDTAGELELGDVSDDADEGLELSDEIEGGLELGEDSAGDLELSGPDDEALELGSSSDNDLDLSEDEGITLSSEDDQSLEMSSDSTDESDLTAEEDLLDFTKDDEVKADNNIGEDSAINLDMVAESEQANEEAPEGTVEFQFSKPEDTVAKEDVSLAFNMGTETENTNTDAQAANEFSLDEVREDSESSGETNPTIVIGSEATAQLKEPNIQTESIQVSPAESINEETRTTADQQALNYTSTVKEDDIERPSDENLIKNYAEDEMIRLQATIRQLREEREDLLEKIGTLETNSQLSKQDNLGQKAEVEELKIEVNILKKRHQNELDEAKYQLRLSDEKRQILEEKSKNYQKEFERLSQKVRIDFNKVKQREKELESQLEMLAMDSESQVKTRDVKILELKRKIDSLEFNMENVSIKEQKSREDKIRLEDKMAKTLRGSIEVLENDVDDESTLVEQQEDEL